MADEFSIQPLIDAFARARAEIRADIGELAEQAADSAKYTLRSAYPQGPTGNLRDRVTVVPSRDGDLVQLYRVRSLAPHTHFIEQGTATRVAYTRKNANRGISPRRGPVFVPTAVEARARYYQHAQVLLDRDRELV